MTVNSLNIYNLHRSAQLGADGVFTQPAYYDPDGENLRLDGIFDEHTFRAGKDKGNARQPLSGARFIISEALTFDVYDDKEIYFPYMDKRYKIQLQDVDEIGGKVLWLV